MRLTNKFLKQIFAEIISRIWRG